MLTFFVHCAIIGVSGRCLWIKIVKMVFGKGHSRIVLCPLLWLTKVAPRLWYIPSILGVRYWGYISKQEGSPMQENELLKRAGRFGFDTRATPHNCACESQPSFCPTSSVWKTRNTYSIPSFSKLWIGTKNPGWASLSNYAVLPYKGNANETDWFHRSFPCCSSPVNSGNSGQTLVIMAQTFAFCKKKTLEFARCILYEFLIKRLKAFYSAAGLRPAATAAKKRSQYISYRRPGGLPWNGLNKMMKSFY